MSSNWVDGDRFFDREVELQLLRERVKDGTHTLLTAQRRMGKTSLVRELLRQLDDDQEIVTVFVDLEGAMDAEDAVAEIATQARPLQSVRRRITSWLRNSVRDVRDNIEELGISELHVKLRAGLNAGNWHQIGDQVFEALAADDRLIVLAIDELPILVNRLLMGHEYEITPERLAVTDGFMGWLRKCCQTYEGKICLIISGSVGLEPVLSQARLSAHANVYTTLDLRPWSQEVAAECLAALARGYKVCLADEIRWEMCRRLRCCVPHHVQLFFHHLYEHLSRNQRYKATLDDVELVYKRDLLSVRGQAGLVHYEERLRMVLGDGGYTEALSLLSEAVVNGGQLTHRVIELYRSEAAETAEENNVVNVLYVLQHDGYLEECEGGYAFVSGLLEDWWRARHGQSFTSIVDR
ncbi:MAG: ATP-binding protein [Chloroflexi bacterium]|nr:ATP-binding protein [Chloroflexota bacterium]